MDIAGAGVPPHIAMANRFFMAVLGGLVLFSICLAPWHGTWTPVLLLGVPTALLLILSILKASGALLTRMMGATATIIFCGLNIDQKKFSSSDDSEQMPGPRRLSA
jgi:methyl-accepting chemotaxis protein